MTDHDQRATARIPSKGADGRLALLLDAYNLLYRAFTSLPSSIEAGGEPINAVYGMLSQVLRLTRDTGALHAVAAFDVPTSPTFRHRLYPAYQGHRGPLGGDRAHDFDRQARIARDILPRIGIPYLEAPGFEADDVMGTLALRLRGASSGALIVSTDRDLLQLVRPGIAVLAPGNPLTVSRTAEDVRARLGVEPQWVPTFKALAGDPSDNIPGVAGIGSRTAEALITKYGALEQIYDALADVPARAASRLAPQREQAFLYREVATIRTDVPLALDPRRLPLLSFDEKERARSILDRLGYGKG